MFDNLLMSMNSKLKKIMSGLETNEGKIDEISTDVGSVGTSVATVQSTSDEIKALIGTEIATQLSTLKTDIISAISNNSGSSGESLLVPSNNIKYTFKSVTGSNYGHSGDVSDLDYALFFVPAQGIITIKLSHVYASKDTDV